MQKTTILFQGDSITDGNRIKNNTTDLNHQIGHSYAYVISGKLGAQYPQDGLQFLNRGISGHRLYDLAQRWQADCLDLQPDVLSILVGVNDVHFSVFGDKKLDISDFETTYKTLINRTQLNNPDVKIILCEPFSFCLGGPAQQWDVWQNLLTRVQDSVRTVARETSVYFLPLQHMFDSLAQNPQPSYWLWDGVHPTESGHWMIANAWLEFVQNNNILT